MILKKAKGHIRISIIIVSYNTAKLLERCLLSVYIVLKSDGYDKISEVIVIDNHSTDGSTGLVRSKFPKAKLITNKANLGFAKGNNQGIVRSCGEYILLLNSDALLTVGSMKSLVDDLDNNRHFGVVGPKLLFRNDKFQQSAGYLPDLFQVINWMLFIDDLPVIGKFLKPYHMSSEAFYKKGAIVGWVSGACFMVRKSVIETSGMMDENIFMYGEEVEWCYRINKKGHQVYFEPRAVVYHEKGSSGDGEYAGILEEFKALQYIYHIHKSCNDQQILNLILRLGALLRTVIFGIIGRNSIKKAIYAKAYKLV